MKIIRRSNRKIAVIRNGAVALVAIFQTLTVFAGVKISVADGNWNNPSNWNPAGVPLLEDTLILNHHLTASDDIEFGASWFIVNTGASLSADSSVAVHGSVRLNGQLDALNYADGDGDSTLIYGELNASVIATGNPVTINHGLMHAITWASSDLFYNYETIEAVVFASGSTFYNYNLIQTDSCITDEFYNHGTLESLFMVTGARFDNQGLLNGAKFLIDGSSEPFTNFAGAAMVASDTCYFTGTVVNQENATMVLNTLLASDDLTNDGDISLTNWMHSNGTTGGTTGKFCISDCFINLASIDGTVDICDATPGNLICDMDFGTIAPSVTFCAAEPCGNNLGVEVTETALSIWPNPTSGDITISNLESGSVYQLFDPSGKIWANGISTDLPVQLDLELLSPGIYFVRVQHNQTFSVSKVVKN